MRTRVSAESDIAPSRAEHLLAAGEAQMRALREAAVDGILRIDACGTIQAINPSAEKLFGYRADELVGQNVKMLMPSPYQEGHDGYLARYLATGEKRIIGIGREVVALKKDGTVFPIELSVAEARVGDDHVFMGIVRDITDRKRAEAELRQSESRLREQTRILDHGQILIRDLQDRITHWSQGAARLYGWSHEEAVGQVSHRLLQTTFPVPLDAIRAQLEREGEWEGELIHRRKDGNSIPVATHWVLHRAEDGTAQAILEVTNDITQRRLAEESRASLAAIVESSEDAIVSQALDGTIMSWNAGAERIFGYSAGEVIGRHISILAPPERPCEIQGILERIKRGDRVPHFETVRVRKDGQRIDVSVSVSPIKDATGKVLGASAIKRDITEQKRVNEEIRTMTQQLWQAAKLASVGELAAGIAHELNNPMATVSLRIESVLARTPADDPRRRALEIIEQETKRMGDLVSNLLQFSRKSEEKISTVDLCQELGKAVELIQHHLRKAQVTLVQELAPDTPIIYADRQKLRQVFLNLLSNACDAMPRGGTLTLRTSACSLPNNQSAVQIEFSDTGVGIPADQLDKVLEPFFTTKEEGKGTGLGLAICRRVVQEHRGTIEIRSEVGRGTTVRLVLPVRIGSNVAPLRTKRVK